MRARCFEVEQIIVSGIRANQSLSKEECTSSSSSSAPTEAPNTIRAIAHILLIDLSSSTTSFCEPVSHLSTRYTSP